LTQQRGYPSSKPSAPASPASSAAVARSGKDGLSDTKRISKPLCGTMRVIVTPLREKESLSLGLSALCSVFADALVWISFKSATAQRSPKDRQNLKTAS